MVDFVFQPALLLVYFNRSPPPLAIKLKYKSLPGIG